MSDLPDSNSSGFSRVWDRPTKQARVWRNRLLSFFTKHNLNLVTAALLLASLFFYLKIQPIRNKALSDNPDLFRDGQTVKIARVIDGDELRVENDLGSTRFRLLGIKSFDAKARDLTVSEFGKMCVSYLETNYVGKNAKIELSVRGTDNEGRLLGRLVVEGADISGELVDAGMTLVYRRYGFDKMDEYLQRQETAKQQQQGLWASPRAVTRAESLLRLWQQERDEEEAGR